MTKKPPYTQAQRDEFIAKVTDLRKTGLSVKEACAKVNVHPASLYMWMQKAKKIQPTIKRTPRKSSPINLVNLTVPSQSDDKCVVIIGSSTTVKSMLDQIYGQRA